MESPESLGIKGEGEGSLIGWIATHCPTMRLHSGQDLVASDCSHHLEMQDLWKQ